MPSDRYFIIDASPSPGETVLLDPGESRHLEKTLRAGTGDPVRLLDGRGGIFEGRIRGSEKGRTVVEILNVAGTAEPVPVDMAIGLARAHRMDIAVEKCAEIGIRRILPVRSERSLWKGGREEERSKVERLVRKVHAACKQSGNPWLTGISDVKTPAELARIIGGYGCVLVGDASGGRIEDLLERHEEGTVSGRGYLGVTGPEGGFTPEELETLVSAGASPVSLGSYRLRSETAATCLAWALVRSVPARDR